MYDVADSDQLDRLSKYVRCIQRNKGTKVKCKKLFINFNTDILENVEAEEVYFVAHANFEELGYKPPINDNRIDKFIGVSDFASGKLELYGEKIGRKLKCETIYNPLTLEPKEKVVHIVSAGRLNDVVKGGERTRQLIKALDRYAEENNIHYMWTIFTYKKTKGKAIDYKIDSKNVAIMEPRVDVRPYIAEADYVAQLSNDMETYCYTINEALGYGVPIITTPLTVLNELPITDNEKIVLNWDCSNVDEVAKQIFEKQVKPFNYEIPQDDWGDFIIKNKSKYKEELKMQYKVKATDKYRATNTYDVELSKEKNIKEYIPQPNEEFVVSKLRAEKLSKLGFITIVEEIKEEAKKPTPTKKRTAKK